MSTEQEWTPLTRGEVEVRGIDPQSDTITVGIKLSGLPPPEWHQFFAEPTDIAMPVNWRHLKLRSRDIETVIDESKLEKYVAHIDERIAHTNRHYEEMVLPQLRAEERRREVERDEHNRRRQQARARAKGL